MEYYSVIRKEEILPFVTTWIDLENIMLSENNSDRKSQEPYDFICMWDIKLKATNEQTRQRNKQKANIDTIVWQLPERKR